MESGEFEKKFKESQKKLTDLENINTTLNLEIINLSRENKSLDNDKLDLDARLKKMAKNVSSFENMETASFPINDEHKIRIKEIERQNKDLEESMFLYLEKSKK